MAGAVGAIGVAASSGSDGGAGAAGTAGGAKPGPGCGKPLPAKQPPTIPGKPNGYTPYTVMGTGATLAGPVPAKAGPRTFWVRVPPTTIPTTSTASSTSVRAAAATTSRTRQTCQLFSEPQGGTEEAIYVALDIPTDMANQDCYDNSDGPSSQEWEAFELFHTFVDSNYCVDNDRIYVSGYSTGGWLANMWGCYFAGDGQRPWNGVPGGDSAAAPPPRRAGSRPQYHIRGQASVSGGEPANNPPCNGPVAAIWIHDLDGPQPLHGEPRRRAPARAEDERLLQAPVRRRCRGTRTSWARACASSTRIAPPLTPSSSARPSARVTPTSTSARSPASPLFFDEASAP